VKGQYFYWYMVLDVFSLKIVAHEVHEEESAHHAGHLMRRASLTEARIGKPLVLHSDDGSAMRGSTMLATLENLGVAASFSRPRVSNDNAYAESLFRTCKYRPDYPRKPSQMRRLRGNACKTRGRTLWCPRTSNECRGNALEEAPFSSNSGYCDVAPPPGGGGPL
jgi:transposase InsO family protein